jgi:hypothetical protein
VEQIESDDAHVFGGGFPRLGETRAGREQNACRSEDPDQSPGDPGPAGRYPAGYNRLHLRLHLSFRSKERDPEWIGY